MGGRLDTATAHRQETISEDHAMATPDHPTRTRRHTRAVLWLIVAGMALGVFLTGMVGTGVALAQDTASHGAEHPLVVATLPR